VRAISYRNLDLKMPPTGKLSDEQIADFTAWISMGAPDPRGDESQPPVKKGTHFVDARKFWAFQPVKDPPPPSVKHGGWPTSLLGRFVLARLEEKNLEPAPAADKRTLIRRVTLDLTGLPPARQEVQDFVADQTPTALATVVDRLLASPHYGERWARHWL